MKKITVEVHSISWTTEHPIVADMYSDGKRSPAKFYFPETSVKLSPNDVVVSWVEVFDDFDCYVNMPFVVMDYYSIIAYGRVLKLSWDTPEH